MKNIFLNDLYIHIISLFSVIIFALLSCIYILFNDEYNTILRIVCIYVITCIIFLISRKETFFPFLGMTFVPSNLFVNSPIYPVGSNVNYTINMEEYKDNSVIMYWASENKSNIFENPYDYYDKVSNTGVSIVKDGKANIHMFCPEKNKVNKSSSQTLEKHFHYRVIFKDTGFISPVMSVKVNC